MGESETIQGSVSISTDNLVDSIKDKSSSVYYFNMSSGKMVKVDKYSDLQKFNYDPTKLGYVPYSKTEIKNILANDLSKSVNNLEKEKKEAFTKIKSSQSLDEKISILTDLKKRIDSEIDLIKENAKVLETPNAEERKQQEKIALVVDGIAEGLKQIGKETSKEAEKVDDLLKFYTSLKEKLASFNAKDLIELRNSTRDKSQKEEIDHAVKQAFTHKLAQDNFADLGRNLKNYVEFEKAIPRNRHEEARASQRNGRPFKVNRNFPHKVRNRLSLS